MIFNKEIQITGKHAHYVRELTQNKFSEDSKQRGVFNRNLDVFMIAPVLGIIYSKKSKKDLKNLHDIIRINFEQLNIHRESLNFVLKLVVYNSNDDDIESRISKTFQNVNSIEDLENISNIYFEYLLGGIEYLYDVLIKDARNFDDILNSMNRMVNMFNNQYSIDTSEQPNLFDL